MTDYKREAIIAAMKRLGASDGIFQRVNQQFKVLFSSEDEHNLLVTAESVKQFIHEQPEPVTQRSSEDALITAAMMFGMAVAFKLVDRLERES